MEKQYTFIKSGRAESTLVFSEQNDDLAQKIATEQGYDSFVWLADTLAPQRWATYDGTSFTEPTNDYLVSIGVIPPPTDATAGLESPAN